MKYCNWGEAKKMSKIKFVSPKKIRKGESQLIVMGVGNSLQLNIATAVLVKLCKTMHRLKFLFHRRALFC